MTMAPTPDRDLYAALGLGTDASTAELRRAYRALALQLHPDRNPDPAAAGRFRAVTAAYAVLADPVRRADYDASRATPPTATAPAPDPAPEPGRVADYVPASEPVAYTDYAPADGYAPPPPPPPPAPAPAPARAPAPAPGPGVQVPAGWPTGRINTGRPLGRVLLGVWRLAPLPRHRFAAVVTVLGTLGVAYIAAASRQTMPVEATVIGALATVALACWSVRAVVWTVLATRARRAVKETR